MTEVFCYFIRRKYEIIIAFVNYGRKLKRVIREIDGDVWYLFHCVYECMRNYQEVSNVFHARKLQVTARDIIHKYKDLLFENSDVLRPQMDDILMALSIHFRCLFVIIAPHFRENNEAVMCTVFPYQEQKQIFMELNCRRCTFLQYDDHLDVLEESDQQLQTDYDQLSEENWVNLWKKAKTVKTTGN